MPAPRRRPGSHDGAFGSLARPKPPEPPSRSNLSHRIESFSLTDELRLCSASMQLEYRGASGFEGLHRRFRSEYIQYVQYGEPLPTLEPEHYDDEQRHDRIRRFSLTLIWELRRSRFGCG